MKRKGMGKGQGKGYKNLTGHDPRVHSMSAKGMKQPQKIGRFARCPPGNPDDNDAKRHSECARGIKSGFNTPYLQTLYNTGELRRRWGLETDSGSQYFRLRQEGYSDEYAQYSDYESRGLIKDGKMTTKGYLGGLRDEAQEMTTSDMQGATDVRASQFMEEFDIEKDRMTQIEISDIMLKYSNYYFTYDVAEMLLDDYKKPKRARERRIDRQRYKRNFIVFDEVRNNLITKRFKENPSVLGVRIVEGVDRELAPFRRELKEDRPIALLRQQPGFKKLMKEAGVK
jgi:hypothetical protein